MKCIFCAAPMPIKGLNCNYCNKLNPMNQELLDKQTKKTTTSSYLCPVCNIELEAIKTTELFLNGCTQCDGILIEEEEFEKLIEYKANKKNPLNSHYLHFIQNHPRDNRKKSQYHNCPICKKAMSIINYKKNSGIIMDICHEHGIWLDGGELKQIIDWYEASGDQKV